MRRGSVAFSALALIGVGLAGCGLFRSEQREAWRNQAEEACLSRKLVQPTAYMSRMSAIEGPGACGMNHPFKIAAFAQGSVGLASPVTLACPIVPTIDSWLAEVVQPAASLYFGSAVVEVRSGSYSCRSRNGRRGARLSEHSFGNALDVMAFRFADGREVAVVKGWRGAPGAGVPARGLHRRLQLLHHRPRAGRRRLPLRPFPSRPRPARSARQASRLQAGAEVHAAARH